MRQQLLEQRWNQVQGMQQQLADVAPSYGKDSSAYMKSFLQDHFKRDIDPDRTYLNEYVQPHRTAYAVGGPYATHNKDAGKLISSRSLSQVAIDNITDPLGVHFQNGEQNYRIATDNDPTKRYDQQTDVIEPRAFYKSLSDLDFMSDYTRKINDYYDDNAATLSRTRRSAARLEIDTQHFNGELSDDDRQLALRGIYGHKGAALASDEDTDKEAEKPGDDDAQRLNDYRNTAVYPLDVAGYSSNDSLRIEDRTSARTLLYMPGEAQPIQAFANRNEARDWLKAQSGTQGWNRRFAEGHFAANDAGGRMDTLGVKKYLDGERDHRERSTSHIGPDFGSRGDHYLESRRDIRDDPFGALNEISRDGQLRDAKYDITTNSDANKGNLRRGLSAVPLPFVGSIPGLFLAKTPEQYRESATQIGVDVASLALPYPKPLKPIARLPIR